MMRKSEGPPGMGAQDHSAPLVFAHNSFSGQKLSVAKKTTKEPRTNGVQKIRGFGVWCGFCGVENQ